MPSHQSVFTALLLLVMQLGITSILIADDGNCHIQNDQLINNRLSNKELEIQLSEWDSLLQQCQSSPLILHNIAVVHAKLGQWDNAAKYFKESLESEPLAAQSYQQLNSIYRYQAVTAYRAALHSNTPAPKTPAFSYQNSSLLTSADQETQAEPLTVDSSALNALTKDWIEGKELDTAANDMEFLLIEESAAPYAVIHTKERTYILGFVKSSDRWQISQERTIP